MSTRIGVTGATGRIGSSTARHLAAGGTPVRLVVRDAARAPDLPHAEVAVASYEDAEACRRAFDGLDTLFLVSASESATRVADHVTAIDAAVAAGVRQIVYLSFVGAGPDASFTLARDHGATEEHLRASPVTWTFLRDNFYTDAIRMMFGEDDVIRGPAGDGAVACVAQADVAAVAARVLEDPTAHAHRAYQLTGPQALTLAEVAAILADVTGRPASYVDETIAQAHASRAHYGAPEWMVDAWISTYTAIRDGELDEVCPDVPELLGRPALTVRDVFSGHR